MLNVHERSTMKVKILSQKENPLFKRKEIVFEVDHQETKSTPPRTEVKKALANVLGVDQNLVFIRRFETRTGTQIAQGHANVYESVEQAKKTEPPYIIKRNLPPEPPKEGKEEAKEEKAEEKKEELKKEEKEEKIEKKEEGKEKKEE